MDAFIQALEIVSARYPWAVVAVIGIFGTIVGSFLNVCIARLPLGRSVVSPRSHCACGKPIPWYDNLPVLSWFLLRGKCRPCGIAYGFRYPFVEALTGIIFAALWVLHSPLVAAVLMVFLALLIVATFVDLDYLIIPDSVSVGGAIVGLFLSFCVPALHGYSGAEPSHFFQSGLTSLIGLFVGTALVYWIALLGSLLLKKDAMGEGDMKLLACIGAFTGWEGAVFSLFGGAVLGLIIFLPLQLLQKGKPLPLTALWSDWDQLYPQDPEKGAASARSGLVLPFGPMLALGAAVYVLGLQGSVDAYFEGIALLFR
jgi:leader peptidase (prepilin peptidase)/N-methyltransferase